MALERPSPDDIRVHLDGWQTWNHAPNMWSDVTGMVFSVDVFDLPPDISAPLDDLRGLRHFYRTLARQNGLALLECDVVPFGAFRAVRVVLKMPLQPRGFGFVGSLTLPFRDCSYVLKYQAAEGQPTGLRESLVAAQMMQAVDDPEGVMRSWCADPYDPSLKYEPMCNKADDPAWDARFPEHPLSRVRAALNLLPQHTELAPRLRGWPAF